MSALKIYNEILTKYFVITLLFFGCNNQSIIDIRYNDPQLWDEPINDYLQVGEKKYGNDFDKRIGALSVFNNKLWIGYGDTRVNMGSSIPIEFRKYDNPESPKISSTPFLAKSSNLKILDNGPFNFIVFPFIFIPPATIQF